MISSNVKTPLCQISISVVQLAVALHRNPVKNRVFKSVSGMPSRWHLVCAVATRSAKAVKPSSAMKLFNAMSSSFDAINFAVSLSRRHSDSSATIHSATTCGTKSGFPAITMAYVSDQRRSKVESSMCFPISPKIVVHATSHLRRFVAVSPVYSACPAGVMPSLKKMRG